ncbi:unknown [Acidiphilium sp. CAG:727]|nr:unknown [Acidiphilium sp. CAG:727]
MKNSKRNVIVSAFMAIALCMSVVAGATFALFTSDSSVNIAITSGNVEVTATASALKVYSPKAVNETGIADADNAVNENGGKFVNGGTATLTGSELKLDNMTPGDKVNFNIKVENKSSVTVKYRTRIYCGEDNGLYAGLKYSITNGTETYESMAITDWATLTPDVKEVANLDCKVELPVEAGNEYKNKSCKLVYQVEAVQGNAETANDTKYYTLAQFNALTEIPAEVKNVYVDLGNATVKYGKTLTIGKNTAKLLQSVKPKSATLLLIWT